MGLKWTVIMPEEPREKEWVEAAQRGDENAFAEAFATMRERLLATIRKRLGPALQARMDPEDVLQDTFVRAFHSLNRFEWRGEGSFRRWLESIATHVTLDAVRYQGRRKTLQIELDVQADGTSPSQAIRRQERWKRLKSSMEALSDDHRTVLELSRMKGLTIKEIARQMDRSENAIKNLLLRATKLLRRSFGETESFNLGDGTFDVPEAADDD